VNANSNQQLDAVTDPAPGTAAPGRAANALNGRICELRIATYNIHGGLPVWTTQSKWQMISRIAHVVEELDADIVALQEVPLGGSDAPDVLSQLRETTGMFAVEGPTLDTPRRRYGNAVLSKLPIRMARTLDLSFHGREPRGALDADIECAGQLIRVVATHLGLSASERSTQVRTLLAAFDNSALPVILVGDINEWFVRGRALRALVSHFRRAPAPRTFPTFCPVFALDRIWVHPGECLVDVTVHRSALARRASDHYPLVARIRMPADTSHGDLSGEMP
jgi:endonuclease/exonuclease/phosphatase family metal-dependent hydrolase